MKKLLFLILLCACKNQTSQVQTSNVQAEEVQNCAVWEEAVRMQVEMKNEFDTNTAKGKRYFDIGAYEDAHENLKRCLASKATKAVAAIGGDGYHETFNNMKVGEYYPSLNGPHKVRYSGYVVKGVPIMCKDGSTSEYCKKLPPAKQ